MIETYFALFVCATLAVSCGLFRVYDGVLLLKEMEISPPVKMTVIDAYLNIIGPLSLGVVIGASIFTFAKYYHSRKLRLIAVGIPAIIATILYKADAWDGSFSPSVKGGFGIRLLNACTLGAAEAVLPVYLGEIIRNSYRGIVCISMALWSQIGVLVVVSVSRKATEIPELLWGTVGGIILIFYTIVVPFIPKSPCYLAMAGQKQQTRISMVCLYDNIEQGEEHAADLEKAAEKEGSNSRRCRLFSDPSCRKACFIMIILAVCSELSGASLAYLFQYFLNENPTFGGKDEPIYIGLAKFAGIVLGMSLIDVAGRRILIGISGGLATLCVAGIAVLFAFAEVVNREVPDTSKYIGILLLLYTLFMSIGIYTVPLVLVSELFPTSERLLASGLFVVIKQILFFAITIVHGNYNDKKISYILFAVYAVVLIVGSSLVVYILPETKGKTFSKIQESLCKKEESDTTEQNKEDEADNPQTEQADEEVPETDTPSDPDQPDDPESSNRKHVNFEISSSLQVL